LLSARLKEEEEKRIELTERQAGILDFLQRQRRVMIAGGAGTGKTLIAKEKASRLAGEGMRVLLLCYNRGLADHLREQCASIEGLDVASFHQVCDLWTRRVLAESGVDLLAEARREYPGADLFNHLMPIALSNAVDRSGGIYDAIIVDEAQDFADDFWLPVEMLLTDPESGLLYVFLDENQDIYRRSASIPIHGEPLVLDRNCRNTAAIHEAAYRHYRGGLVQRSAIAGSPVEFLNAPTLEQQAKQIGQLVTRLTQTEGILAHEIAVLLCTARNRATCEKLLSQCPLPKTLRLGRIEDYGPDSLTVDTVARFKGLERAVIIVWEFADCDPDRDRETFYVGLSRAKSLLFICGTKEAHTAKFGDI
ncbi:MAG: AAA family ATPase, partial [Roseovarius sp.]